MATLTLERVFAATPERVYAYVTEPELLARWWGPEGTTLGHSDLDFSRTGDWFFTLIMPDGRTSRVTGTVLSVDPPRAVEFTLIVHGPKGGTSIDSTVRFEVTADPSGGTRLTLIQTGLSSDQMAEASSKGWVSTLARLEREITTNP